MHVADRTLGVAAKTSRSEMGAFAAGGFAVFATSQFLPTQGYDPGFLDVYDYVLVLTAASAMLGHAYLVAAAVGFAGPFRLAYCFDLGVLA